MRWIFPSLAFRRLTAAVNAAAAFAGMSFSYPAHASVTYGYDTLGRITTAFYDNESCIVYGYDIVNNLVSQTNYLPPQSTPPMWGTATWGSYTWSSSAQNAAWGSGLWGCSPWSP